MPSMPQRSNGPIICYPKDFDCKRMLDDTGAYIGLKQGSESLLTDMNGYDCPEEDSSCPIRYEPIEDSSQMRIPLL